MKFAEEKLLILVKTRFASNVFKSPTIFINFVIVVFSYKTFLFIKSFLLQSKSFKAK